MSRPPGQYWPRPRPADMSIVAAHSHHDADDGGLLDIDSIPSSALGTGTANSIVFLRGDRTWAAAGGGGGGSGDLITGMDVHLKADAGLSLSDTDPVTTWADQSGNGIDFSNSGGSDRPVFYEDGEGDGLPFIRFDGSNDYLQTASYPAIGGSGATIYLLCRFFGFATYGGLLSCSSASDNDYDSHARFNVGFNDGTLTSPYLFRNNNKMGVPWSAWTSNHRDNYGWGIFVGTYRVIRGEGCVTAMWVPGWRSNTDYAVQNFTFTHVVLGARRNGGSIANFTRADYREVIMYGEGHTDKQIAQNIDYLAGKWGVPRL